MTASARGCGAKNLDAGHEYECGVDGFRCVNHRQLYPELIRMKAVVPTQGCGAFTSDGVCGHADTLCVNCRTKLEPPRAAEGATADAPASEGYRDPGSFAPYVPGQHHIPAYYKQTRSNPRISPEADVEDVLHAFGVDSRRIGEAVIYLLRAGRKPGEPVAKDISKACEKLTRELRFLEMEGGA